MNGVHSVGLCDVLLSSCVLQPGSTAHTAPTATEYMEIIVLARDVFDIFSFGQPPNSPTGYTINQYSAPNVSSQESVNK